MLLLDKNIEEVHLKAMIPKSNKQNGLPILSLQSLQNSKVATLKDSLQSAKEKLKLQKVHKTNKKKKTLNPTPTASLHPLSAGSIDPLSTSTFRSEKTIKWFWNETTGGYRWPSSVIFHSLDKGPQFKNFLNPGHLCGSVS